MSRNTSENEILSIYSDTPRLVKRSLPSCPLLEEAELALEKLIEGTMVYASGFARTIDQEAFKAL